MLRAVRSSAEPSLGGNRAPKQPNVPNVSAVSTLIHMCIPPSVYYTYTINSIKIIVIITPV